MFQTITTRYGKKYAPAINLHSIRLARETGIALRARVGCYIYDMPARRWRVPVEVFAVREGAEPLSICRFTLSSAGPPPDEMSLIHLLVIQWWSLSREGAPHPPPALDDGDPYRDLKESLVAGFNELVRRLEERRS